LRAKASTSLEQVFSEMLFHLLEARMGRGWRAGCVQRGGARARAGEA
jgi:hypothetical protein